MCLFAGEGSQLKLQVSIIFLVSKVGSDLWVEKVLIHHTLSVKQGNT